MSQDIPWQEAPREFDTLWYESPLLGGVPDMMQTMFEQQRQHMEAYADTSISFHSPMSGAPTGDVDLDHLRTQAAIREAASYTVEELYEAINLLKNKPWKNTPRHTDREAFLEELADMWHFLIEMHIIAGVSPLEVFQAYFAKTLINNTRRETGY
jgi:hypothetical protein